MKKFLLIFTLIVGNSIPQVISSDQNVRLNLPWELIQKILKLDQSEVRLEWNEFQILLAHTTATSLPRYSVKEGDVVMSREEFKRLIGGLLPPPEQPSQTYLTKAVYKGSLRKGSASFSANFDLHVDNKDKKDLSIDVFPAAHAFQEVLVDGSPAITEVKNGRLYIATSKNGQLNLEIRFSVKRPDNAGEQRLNFPIVRTPITRVELFIPGENFDVNFSNALSAEINRGGEGTQARAILSPTETLSFNWNLVVPEKEKGPAKIYADVDHLISIEDDALKVASLVNLQVLQNSVNAAELEIPKGFDVLDVQGELVGDWREEGKESVILRVPFQHARQGTFSFTVILEHTLAEDKATGVFDGLHVRGAIREKGTVGVELKSSAEVSLPEDPKNLERIDIQELPTSLIARTQRPFLYGFKYLRPPYELKLHVERHPDVHTLSSVIDRASVLTWLTEDAKVVHQLVYHLKNTSKQFLELQLPKGAQLWSVFVGGQPAKPTNNQSEKLLIPLNRSQSGRGFLESFQVEVVYFETGTKLWPLGLTTFQMPMPDMMVNQFEWSFYFPKEHSYFYLGRELDRTGLPAPVSVNGLMSVDNLMEMKERKDLRDERVGGKDQVRANEVYKKAATETPAAPDASVVGNEEVSEADAVEQLVARRESQLLSPKADHRVAGVLPIRVRLPVQGIFRQYSKSLLMPGAPIKPHFFYLADPIFVLLKLLALLALGAFGYKERHRLLKIMSAAQPYLDGQFPYLKKLTSPSGLLIAVTVLGLASTSCGYGWRMIAVVAFMGALSRWLFSIFKISKGGLV